MTNYDTISTETWTIRLPSDWLKRDCSVQYTIYYESGDGTKGAYFSTWCFQNDFRTAKEILESFRRVEVRTLQEMEENTWETVGQWNSDKPELSVLGEDFLDRHASYRIAYHLIVRLPWLVRSTFHDYSCTNHHDSKQFFQPIIDSLEIHKEDV